VRSLNTAISLIILLVFFCGYFGAQVASWVVNYTPVGVPKPIGMPDRVAPPYEPLPETVRKAEKAHKWPTVTSSATAIMSPAIETTRCRQEGRDLVCRKVYEVQFF